MVNSQDRQTLRFHPLRPTDARVLHDELRVLYQKYAALYDPEIGAPHLLGLMFTRD
jgi:hypothetical protein